MPVTGVRLTYASAGEGPPVVFLHGALTDYRMWHRHRALMAERYRTVAYTQRYFGTEPWADDWPPFGISLHTADLLEFLTRLEAGPVHLVAWSYAGHIALHAALQQPELFHSLFIYETGTPTFVTDPADLAAFAADAQAMFGPVFEAVQGGDLVAGVRRLIDASGQKVGYFEAQPERQALLLDNARTLPLQLSQTEPPLISCEQLGRLTLPVCMAYGELTRPLFKIVSQAAARCLPHCRPLSVAGATHMWPDESPADFCAAVVDFLQSLKEH